MGFEIGMITKEEVLGVNGPTKITIECNGLIYRFCISIINYVGIGIEVVDLERNGMNFRRKKKKENEE